MAIINEPNCLLSWWYYAIALDMSGNDERAKNAYEYILKKGITYFNQQLRCNEGETWNRAVFNDMRGHLGLIYAKEGNSKLASRWFKLHLRLRRKGQKSVFSKKEIIKLEAANGRL